MGGREISPADKASLDAWYIENMSFALDVEIMFRTVPMILFGEMVNAQAIRQACAMTGRTPDYQAAVDCSAKAPTVARLKGAQSPQSDARS